ncbi:hypothetical protein KDW_31410 [Dictyobacter vulcani]|uniref:Protein kinase domain-containing protein n=1 Tax=Dictyobacter vulcani TaxID=2607529 RepID=A0A5J4KSA6_9CHLR|nr:serine/threonine-protein kinase [Dictyobacter vulcani]GER88979.1 hypothetical protein KDW_31410 [Dictyobacter vulcani]
MENVKNRQIGNYKLCQLIGHGGFADVYLGEHLFLQRQAAIKLLQTRFADPLAIENFQREAQLIAQFNHPHIVRVLEFGLSEQLPYLVMEYAPHGTLRERHAQGTRLSLETILSYVTQIGAAIQYAHDQRLVHRDIKPANILLDQNNKLLLSDFGIALLQETVQQSTKAAIGTIAYMAPEQLQGKPCAASDQYALAIMIYEWISGKVPFQGSTTEVCTQHLCTLPPSLREAVPTLPLEVEKIIFKALAKEPDHRYANIHTFVQTFTEAIHSPYQQTEQAVSQTITTYPENRHSQTTIYSPRTTVPVDSHPAHTHIAIIQTPHPQRPVSDWMVSHIVYPLGCTIILYLLLLTIGFGLKKELFIPTSSAQSVMAVTITFAISLGIVFFIHLIIKQRRA